MRASDGETCVNLINLCLGVGILSMPWSFAGASIVGGLSIIAGGTLWCAATNVMMVSLAEETQEFNTARMLRQFPYGHILEPFANFMLLCTNLLCLVGYLVVFSENLEKVAEEAHVASSLWGHSWSRPLLVGLGCLIILPLSFLDQSHLAWTSRVSVIANWYICFALVGEAVASKPSQVCVAGLGVGDLTMLAVVMMAASVQQCVLSLYSEMQNRTIKRFATIQLIAAALVIILLSVVSVAGYIRSGPRVASNMLLELPSDGVGFMAQVSILPVVIGVYPLLLYPLTDVVKDFMSSSCTAGQMALLNGAAAASPGQDIPRRTVTRSTAQGRAMLLPWHLAIVTFTGVAASSGVDMGRINDVTGILGLGWFTVAMPALVYRRYLQLKGGSSRLLPVHLTVGGILFALTLIWTGNHVESIEAHCTWWWPGRSSSEARA